MDKEEFLRSEAARILTQYDSIDAAIASGWQFTDEQLSMFRSLSSDEIASVKLRHMASLHPGIFKNAIILEGGEDG
jgi:hypothetical protein